MPAQVLQFPAMARTSRTIDVTPEPPNRVREWRMRYNLTLMDLSNKIGMAHGHLARIERGLRDLNQQWMERIGETLGIAPADLLLLKHGGLTENERELIEIYRALPPSLRQVYDSLRESHRDYVGPNTDKDERTRA